MYLYWLFREFDLTKPEIYRYKKIKIHFFPKKRKISLIYLLKIQLKVNHQVRSVHSISVCRNFFNKKFTKALVLSTKVLYLISSAKPQSTSNLGSIPFT